MFIIREFIPIVKYLGALKLIKFALNAQGYRGFVEKNQFF